MLTALDGPTRSFSFARRVTGGSCNAVPMGVIAAQNKAPSCKFTNPKNLDVRPLPRRRSPELSEPS